MPLKSVDCLRDLRLMYEAATVDDIYDAYAQVCWCLGIREGGGAGIRASKCLLGDEGGWGGPRGGCSSVRVLTVGQLHCSLAAGVAAAAAGQVLLARPNPVVPSPRRGREKGGGMLVCPRPPPPVTL